MNRIIRMSALPTALLLGLALSACGSSTTAGSHMGSTPGTMSSSSSMPMSSGSGSGSMGGMHNAADSTFTTSMIAHHEQAVQMAMLAGTRAKSPEVKALAAKIEAQQSPEITMMNGWRNGWGIPLRMPGSSAHMQLGPGMMRGADMTRLMNLSGSAFDKQFLTMMTAHHNGAIAMARAEHAAGKNAAAKKLAASIIKDQDAEITQMKAMMTAGGM